MRRPRPVEEPDHRDRWIIPYADFITLLFALFAVLYAISAVDRDRFEGLSRGLREALSRSGASPLAAGPGRGTPASGPLGSTWSRAQAPAIPVAALRDRIEAALEAEAAPEELVRRVTLEVEERGLVISLDGDSLFEVGTARIRTGFLPLLDVVTSELASMDAALRVEAHAPEDDGSRDPRFESSWELSAARAGALVRLLVERSGLDSTRLAAAGYGGYRPAGSASSAGKDRRVELVVLSGQAIRGEPGSGAAPRSLSSVLNRLPRPLDSLSRAGENPPRED